MLFLEGGYFFGRVIVILIVHGPVVGVLKIDVYEFEDSFWEDEYSVGREIDIGVFVAEGIQAALQDAKQLDFLEVFEFLVPGFDFVYEFDFGVLVDSVDLEEVGADTVVFFGPYLNKLENVLAFVVVVALGDFFEVMIVLLSVNKALLFEGEKITISFVFHYF